MSYDQFISDSHFAAFDVEALCGQSDWTGMNLRGGQQIVYQCKNVGDNGTDTTDPTRPNKAMIHLNYQAMIILDSSGVTLLE